ncbi:MAG: hypothetical protein ABI959_06820 [Candidatus Dormiibacterota bacterium]
MAALFLALPIHSALAKDPDMLPSAHHEAARIMSAELAMTQALAQLKALNAQSPPTAPVDRIRYDLTVAAAAYAYRNAAREEELRVYELAGYASVEASVLPLLPKTPRPAPGGPRRFLARRRPTTPGYGPRPASRPDGPPCARPRPGRARSDLAG